MALGIEKTKATIVHIGELVCDGIELAKGGLGNIGKIFEVINDVKVIVENIPGTLPELKDLDAIESGQIAACAYEAVKKIIGVIKK